MNICFLSSMHPAQDKRVFDKEARSLVEAGFAVTHLAPGEASEQTVDGVRLCTYPAPRGLKDRVGQLFSLYKRAKQLDADCYHCNEVDSWLVGVCLKLLRGKKVVFDVHEHYPSAFGEQRLPRWLRPFSAAAIRGLFLALTPLTDHIVLAKRSVASDFPQAHKHVLVQNFTPLATLQNRKLQPVTKQPKTGLTAIHLGLFSKVRGWPQMLAALQRVKDTGLKLSLIGTIYDGSQDEFQRTVEEADIQSQVEQTDWLPFEQAFEQLLQADVGLVLFQPGIQNHVFAMPHKMFDYMLAGLPVIAPVFAEEVSQIVREADCGILVDTSKPEEIAAALRRLTESPQLVQRLGENGKQAVLSKFNWETEASRLIEMYEAMAEALPERPVQTSPAAHQDARRAA